MEGLLVKQMKPLDLSCDILDVLEIPTQNKTRAGEWENFEILFNKIFAKQQDSSYLNCKNNSIVLKDAREIKMGLENTAEQQSIKFYQIIKRECKRSQSFRELITRIHEERSNNQELAPIIFYLGKNCSAFIDSATDWTMDMSELEMFPIDLVHHLSGKKIGVNQGEILMHVLEERFYMQYPDTNFNDSHIKCLTEGSYQARYRNEMGSNGISVYFDLCEK